MCTCKRNPAWERMQAARVDAQIQAEAARANELQAQNPTLSRSDALKQASSELNRVRSN